MKVKGLKRVFSEEQIRQRVGELAAETDALYGDEPLVAICVLKGACIFFADLVRAMKKPNIELDFVRLSSYGMEDASTRTITFKKDVDLALQGKHVLIVEDVIDSGHTMDFLLRQFAARGARSLRLAALVDKHERREVDVATDFVGFALDTGFIVGYGLDYAERYRQLPAVYEVIPE